MTPGATFPDYELPDQSGRRRRLSEIHAGAGQRNDDFWPYGRSMREVLAARET
ncbi:MAG: hypothetical protein H0X16_02215 [Chloroflexi bacterium]|nr:hypothetical protein [Chloroflexota bacterium]